MLARNEVTNSDDIIDSRDVIARIEELQSILTPQDENDAVGESEDYADEQQELAALLALQGEAEGFADWRYGEILIRGSYFKEYAQQFAEEIGAVNADARWPNNCIDWDQAARELKMDYSAVDFDGVEYLIRS